MTDAYIQWIDQRQQEIVNEANTRLRDLQEAKQRYLQTRAAPLPPNEETVTPVAPSTPEATD